MNYKKFLNIQVRDVLFVCSILFIYLAFTGILNGSLFHITNRDYYTALTDALLHGRLDVHTHSKFDLSYYKGKWYTYWGISPVLFVLPFYLIFKSATSDVLYTMVAGLLNILLFYLLIKEFASYLKIKLNQFKIRILILAFALASPNLYLTVFSGVWHTNQIIATLYLLLFYLYFLKFLKNPHQTYLLVSSIVFFNLAWTARYTLIGNGLLFFGLILLAYKKYIAFAVWKILLSVIFISLIFIVSIGFYNNLRFGSPFETGHRYQVGSSLYYIQRQGKSFSVSYIPRSFNFYFLSGEKKLEGIDINHWILLNSNILLTYPFILLSIWNIFSLPYRKLKKNLIIFVCIMLVITINLLFLLIYYYPVARYIFDIIPLLYLINTTSLYGMTRWTYIIFLSYSILISVSSILAYVGII